MDKLSIDKKINLTFEEAAEYSNIGINKIRELAANPSNGISLRIGSKTLIKRKQFEDYLYNKIEI